MQYLGLRWSAEANFFGFPGTVSPRQRLSCGSGLSPPALIFRSVPSSPGANPPGLDAFALPLAFAISQRRHPAVGPSAPQSARLSDARVTLTGDDIAPSADLGISRRPSPPQASTRTLRTDFQMGASIPTYTLSKRTGNGALHGPTLALRR